MSEQSNNGRTFVDWGGLKKESVQIDKDGNLIEVEKVDPNEPKTLEALARKRMRRMGK